MRREPSLECVISIVLIILIAYNCSYKGSSVESDELLYADRLDNESSVASSILKMPPRSTSQSICQDEVKMLTNYLSGEPNPVAVREYYKHHLNQIRVKGALDVENCISALSVEQHEQLDINRSLFLLKKSYDLLDIKTGMWHVDPKVIFSYIFDKLDLTNLEQLRNFTNAVWFMSYLISNPLVNQENSLDYQFVSNLPVYEVDAKVSGFVSFLQIYRNNPWIRTTNALKDKLAQVKLSEHKQYYAANLPSISLSQYRSFQRNILFWQAVVKIILAKQQDLENISPTQILDCLQEESSEPEISGAIVLAVNAGHAKLTMVQAISLIYWLGVNRITNQRELEVMKQSLAALYHGSYQTQEFRNTVFACLYQVMRSEVSTKSKISRIDLEKCIEQAYSNLGQAM